MAEKDLNKRTVEIKINGKTCDFISFELRQGLTGHHTFVIRQNYCAKEKSLWETSPEKVVEQLGCPVTIKIEESEGGVIDFEGVITKIDLGGKSGNQGEAFLYGGSPTLLMTDDYSMDSFTETDLASIVQETITNIGYKIEHKIDTLNNPEIPYVCRYKESSYDFLNRLLADCGEWFFYDGKKIVIGFPAAKDDKEPVTLSYKYDLETMYISSSVGNYDVEQYDYDYTQDRIAQWISPPESKGVNLFTRKAFNFSKSLHTNYTFQSSTIPVFGSHTFNLMENSVNATHYGKLSEGAMLVAVTSTCKTAIGTVISLDIDPEMSRFTKKLGDFRIIETVHRYDDGSKKYENHIKGINAKVEYNPPKDIRHPVALPEVATVTDNVDPDNLGRVKVQFTWQRLEDHPQDKTSGWIRVQHPDAGNSDTVSNDRGFFFVPEIGDQVMVAYEHGDPNRPFVTGSLYHKKNTGGIADNNTVKTIRTRSGHTLEFNDDESGNWGITLKDRNGCLLHFDTNGKNIEITAPETMTLNAKNINITASEQLCTSSGNDTVMQVGAGLTQTIGKNTDITVGEALTGQIGKGVTGTVGEDITLTVTGNILQEAQDITTTAKGEIKIASQGKLALKSAEEVDIAQ